MKRLKELRETLRFTQVDLARMLKVSQQSIARWETGKSEPNIAALRDIAVIFGTSVDDLVGATKPKRKVVSNIYGEFFDGGIDGFWGHLGLLVPNTSQPRWYPVTHDSASRVRGGVEDTHWLTVKTLNNRMLLFRPSSMKRISLLDDASDEPDGGWELAWDAAQGHSLELYSALEQRLYQDEDYEESTSPTLREVVESVIKESGLSEDELLCQITDTFLVHTDGTIVQMDVDPEDLHDAVFYGEMGDIEIFSLEDQNGHERFFPSQFVSLIDMPLRQFLEGAKRALKEMGEVGMSDQHD